MTLFGYLISHPGQLSLVIPPWVDAWNGKSSVDGIYIGLHRILSDFDFSVTNVGTQSTYIFVCDTLLFVWLSSGK